METKFVITIGREFGSGGREIGRRIADLMGVNFYDRKLISETARRSGLSQEILEQKDEKMPDSLIHAFSFGFGVTSGITQDNIFKIQSDTIKEIASRESCVIVGRCADYVLRNMKNCINVFIHAPKDTRISNIMERSGLNEKEAGETMAKIDKARAAFYDFYTNKTWGSSRSYHLSIDSSILGTEKTAQSIKQFVSEALNPI